ncbi:MAG: OmpA family protein [Saprospiraceae bacterium]|jgi:OOP family OmpA-OmpF porin|nr:OmpA family protein [Saprospiraceae bacterium]MBP9209952.1 OmpA family protein [Saprospiraceae bacterium]
MKKVLSAILLLGWAMSPVMGQNQDSLPVQGGQVPPVPSSFQTDTLVRTTSGIGIAGDSSLAWKTGKAKYPPKPKHMWELGLGVGHYFIGGDVDPRVPGFGFNLHVRRALHYAFSFRFDLFYGVAYGLEPQPYSDALDNEQDVFQGYGTNAGGNEWFPAYRTQYFSGSLQGILNIGNILFHKDHNVWNWYMFGGIGLDHNKTDLDLRNAQGNPYTGLVAGSGFSVSEFDTRAGRSRIKTKLKNLYDGDYETPAYKQKGVFRLGDETNVHVLFTAGVGLARKLSKRVNLAFEHQIILTDNDYLDGIHWRSNLDQTTENDVQHYSHFRLAINLGSFKNRKEPLYWLNPLDAVMTDIAELKQRPIFDPTDKDEDGVIDLLDQDDETPPNAPVDTRGVALDSDGDGIPDYKDAEPYSPPGVAVDERGVSITPQHAGLTEEQVRDLIDQRMGIPSGVKDGEAGKAILNNIDWFLPMIHFNLDEYCVLERYAPQLAAVAHVMRTYPSMKVTVHGHTDIRHTNAYNNRLSYNRAMEAITYLVDVYGIQRDRLVLMYGGEDQPLGGHMLNHMINRRVEFRVHQAGEEDMPQPPGPNAGYCFRKKATKSAPPAKTPEKQEKKSGF